MNDATVVNNKQAELFAPQMVNAIEELMAIIRVRYPDAQFEMMQGVDEPESVHLTAVVDVNDSEDVTDLVIERLLAFQVEERLPIHVIPMRPLKRVIAVTRPTTVHLQTLSGK